MKRIVDNTHIPFNFTYYALKLLGKNLYSSPWTAISEIVANGIDAGAKEVYVLVDMCDKEHAVVEIFDSGRGMSVEDLKNKYTLIGRNKREDIDNIAGKTLGRKGIGKLAALYLSPVYVLSTKSDSEKSTWIVDTNQYDDNDIPSLDRIEDSKVCYVASNWWNKCETGTMIHLTDVNLGKIGPEKIKKLGVILAEYYLSTIINCSIYVCVRENINQPITFSKIQKKINFETMYALIDTTGKYYEQLREKVYLTSEDDYPVVNFPRPTVALDAEKYQYTGAIEMQDLTGKLRKINYNLSGWLGIHTSLKKDILLRNVSDTRTFTLRPNSIRLYVRGKLAVDNLMNYISSTQAFANYIEGELSFDILDDDEFEDSSTSSREDYTRSDPRVVELIKIAGKMCSALISERARIGTQINKERDAFLKQKAEEEREKRKSEEELRRKADQARAIAELERDIAQKDAQKNAEDLGSEKRRNSFLKDSLSEDQITYSKRLHMVKINCSTIRNIIGSLVAKKRRDTLTLEVAWEGIQKISYNVERIKAILEYYAIAEFDPKDESVTGDLFEFIDEYCRKISQKVCNEDNHDITIKTNIEGKYVRDFVPQDIAVLVDNTVSNSYKNKANNIVFNLYSQHEQYCMDIIDDGNGLNPNASVSELFEFGKSYTRFGTGVGLYHVKQIANSMHGEIKVNLERKNGFELQVRFRDEI